VNLRLINISLGSVAGQLGFKDRLLVLPFEPLAVHLDASIDRGEAVNPLTYLATNFIMNDCDQLVEMIGALFSLQCFHDDI
jgi:hypothetical protein